MTLSTTHTIQIAETDSCRQHFTQDDPQRLPLAPNLPVVPGHSSIHPPCHNQNRFLALAIRFVIKSFLPPPSAFKILKEGVNYLPTLSAPQNHPQKMPIQTSGWSRGSSLPNFTLGEEKTSPASPMRGGAEITSQRSSLLSLTLHLVSLVYS